MEPKKGPRKTPITLRHVVKQSVWMKNTENNQRQNRTQPTNVHLNNESSRSRRFNIEGPSKSIRQYFSNDKLLVPKHVHLFADQSKIFINSLNNSTHNLILPKIQSRVRARLNEEKSEDQLDELPVVMNRGKPKDVNIKVMLSANLADLVLGPVGSELKNIVLKSKLSVPSSIKAIYNNVSKFNIMPLDTKASMSIHLHGNNLLILGGLGANYVSDLVIYKTKKNDVQNTKNVIFARTKYASIAHENHILVHGGDAEMSYNSRHILNSMYYLNAKTLDFHEIRVKGPDMPYKKAHIMFIIGSEMFLEGGLYMDDTVDNTMYAFNLVSKKIRMVKFGIETEALAHHKCITVNSSANWTSLPDFINENSLCINGRHNLADHNGVNYITAAEINLGTSKELVYVFGGLNDVRRTTSTMRIYQQQNGHLSISYPSVVGKPPLSRCEHNMAFVKGINSLAVTGGRHKLGNGAENVLDDLWLFQLNKNVWMKVDMEMNQRYSFGMTVDGNDLLIFGGFGCGNLIDGVIRKIEFNADLQREYLDYVLAAR